VLIERARTALGDGRWADAVAATAEHRRHYQLGLLAEEREAIAIEALWARGSAKEARRRWHRFGKRFPTSSYRHALTQLMAPGDD